MAATNAAYTAGHFELTIDSHPSSAFVKSLDGGFVKANVIDESVGPTNMRVKHTSTVDIEPISLEIGMSGSREILEWIAASWAMDPQRRNGQLTHADFDYHERFEHQFFDALIIETTFPALDGSAKDPAYLKVKLQPERVMTRKVPPGRRIGGSLVRKHQAWLPSRFQLKIDGIPGLEKVNKLESFSIKQGVKKLYTGLARFPEVEPTKIEFPNLSGTIAAEFAGPLLAWAKSYLVQGKPDPLAQRSGVLEYLDPKGDVLFSISLFEVGIHSAALAPSTANADQIKRVKFELFVGSMKLVPGSGF